MAQFCTSMGLLIFVTRFLGNDIDGKRTRMLTLCQLLACASLTYVKSSHGYGWFLTFSFYVLSIGSQVKSNFVKYRMTQQQTFDYVTVLTLARFSAMLAGAIGPVIGRYVYDTFVAQNAMLAFSATSLMLQLALCVWGESRPPSAKMAVQAGPQPCYRNLTT